MAQSVWRGNIVFGMVTIPIQLYPTTQDKSIHFHLMSPDGKHRLRRKLYDPDTNRDYEYADSVRGYEVAPDQYIVVEPEELDKLQPESGRSLEILQFVDQREIDPIYFQTPYYILPAEEGLKAYRLLVEALADAGKVGIARFVMREREYLAALRVKDMQLVLETLYYADEIRPAQPMPATEKEAKPDPRETKMARQLIDALAGQFKPEQYHDEYRQRVEEMIQKKARGQKITYAPERPAQGAKVIDLFDALKQSLAKKGRKPESLIGRNKPSAGGGKAKKRAAG